MSLFYPVSGYCESVYALEGSEGRDDMLEMGGVHSVVGVDLGESEVTVERVQPSCLQQRDVKKGELLSSLA